MKATRLVTVGGGRKQVGALFFFLALTVVMTYPMVVHFGTGVLGPPGDNFEYLFKLWWFKRALFDLGVSPFFTADVFYPQGYQLAIHEMSLANVALGMPLAVLGGETVAFNGLALLSFLLSAFGGYLLAFRVVGQRMPALLTGVVFAFCSYRMAHLGAGHLNLLGTQWLPFLILELDLVLHTRKMLPAALVGLHFALAALSSWYYAPMFAVFAGAYALLRSRMTRRDPQGVAPDGSDRRLWRLLTVSLLVSGVLIAPSLVQTLQHWQQGEMSFSLREVDVFSASLGDWIVPNLMHPLWGRLVATYYLGRQDVLEYSMSLSWTALALAALAFLPTGSTRRHARRFGLPALLLVLFLASSVLALGTTLHIGGERAYIAVPGWLEERFTQVVGLLANRLALHPMPSYYELRTPGAVYLPLPTLLLYLYVPLFSAMRVWARFALLSAFAVALLAGLGLARLVRWLRSNSMPARRAALVGWTCLMLAAVELLPAPHPLGWSEVKAQPVDEWLSTQAGGGAVIQFPLWRAECGPGLYAATVHGRPLAYGYGPFYPSGYREARAVLWGFPNAESAAVLRVWDVQYVMVRAQAYGERWPEVHRQLAQMEALELVQTIPSEPIYHSGWLAESLPDFGQAFLVDDIYVYELDATVGATRSEHRWTAHFVDRS